MPKTEREPTKAKKCDYCDEYASFKLKEDGLNSYLCEWCYRNRDDAKKRINEE